MAQRRPPKKRAALPPSCDSKQDLWLCGRWERAVSRPYHSARLPGLQENVAPREPALYMRLQHVRPRSLPQVCRQLFLETEEFPPNIRVLALEQGKARAVS